MKDEYLGALLIVGGSIGLLVSIGGLVIYLNSLSRGRGRR